jgi:soluble lytic murein transglycosylase-like protein
VQRKRDQAVVVVAVVSIFRRITRSSSPFCVGFFALSLTHLAAAAPPQDIPTHPPLQSAVSTAISAPAPAPAEAAKPATPETPKPALTPVDAPKPVPETPKPEAPKPQAPQAAQPAPAPAAVPAAAPTTKEKLEGLQRAADMLIEVNTALVPNSPYGQIIYDIALRHSVNPQLVAALIHVESAFNPRAVSRKGAYGLMQILPETARRFGVNRKRDLLDPAKNLEAGVKYLRWLTDRFGGNVHKILAAYNAGEGAVDRFDGIPPYPETQSYVQKIFGLLGFTPDPPPPAPPVPVKDSDRPDVVPAGR